MIFITVGTQNFRFDRLFSEVQRLIKNGIISEPVIAQSGIYTYEAKIDQHSFLNPAQMENFIKEASIVLTHGGTGSIVTALKHNKRPIVIPRKKEFSEHVDDHQHEIATLFKEADVIEVVENIKDLQEKIIRLQSDISSKKNNNSFNFDGGKKITEDILCYLSQR